MAKTDDEKRKVLNNSLIFFIFVTIIYLILILPIGLSIHNQKSCGTSRITNTDSFNSISLSSYVLTDSNTYVLQKFDTRKITAMDYRFCYAIDVNSTTGLKVNVINQQETILGNEYVTSDENFYCSDLDKDEIEQVSFLGIQCTNCNTTEKITLYHEAGGASVENIVYDPDLRVEKTNSVTYALQTLDSCRDRLKTYTVIYLWITFAVILAIWIMVGHQYLIDTFVTKVFK